MGYWEWLALAVVVLLFWKKILAISIIIVVFFGISAALFFAGLCLIMAAILDGIIWIIEKFQENDRQRKLRRAREALRIYGDALSKARKK